MSIKNKFEKCLKAKKTKANPKASTRETNDGFKICSSVPDDDSNISDAFSSDEEQDCTSNCRLTNYTKMGLSETEDGFKICSSVPDDDSDISDAFESDIDEDQWFVDRSKNKVQSGGTDTESTPSKQSVCNSHASFNSSFGKNIKKPLQLIMDDFGLTGKTTSTGGDKKVLSSIKNISDKTLAGSLRILPSVEVVDYSHRGRSKGNPKNNDKKIDSSEVNMKSFIKVSRHDVFTLGMSGFDSKNKKEAKIALAVKLGAKPKRRKPVNYKVFQAEKKKNDIILKEELEEKRRNGFKVKKTTAFKKKAADDISSGLSMGKFKDGVLKLSKSDIKRIKRT